MVFLQVADNQQIISFKWSSTEMKDGECQDLHMFL